MIALTETAKQKLADLLKEENEEGTMLRVAVRPGGCSGYSYEMFFDTEKNDDDQINEYDGVLVVSDTSSAMLLNGAELNYKTGLESGFHIINPNAQKTCGCGQSFS